MTTDFYMGPMEKTAYKTWLLQGVITVSRMRCEQQHSIVSYFAWKRTPALYSLLSLQTKRSGCVTVCE